MPIQPSFLLYSCCLHSIHPFSVHILCPLLMPYYAYTRYLLFPLFLWNTKPCFSPLLMASIRCGIAYMHFQAYNVSSRINLNIPSENKIIFFRRKRFIQLPITIQMYLQKFQGTLNSTMAQKRACSSKNTICDHVDISNVW